MTPEISRLRDIAKYSTGHVIAQFKDGKATGSCIGYTYDLFMFLCKPAKAYTFSTPEMAIKAQEQLEGRDGVTFRVVDIQEAFDTHIRLLEELDRRVRADFHHYTTQEQTA